MRKNFYKELYLLEDIHWWHKAKRGNAFDLLKNALAIKKPKILDVGCGTGKNIEELGKLGDVWGIDFSKDAIYYCKKRGLKNVSIGSAESTRFNRNSFDVITLFDVLEHTDDKKTLREIQRILKPGGLLLITVPAFQALWSQWDVVLHHKKRYTKKSLCDILEKNSFTPVTTSYMFSFLFFPAYIVRVVKSKFFQKDYPSDFKLNSPFINWFMFKTARIETFFVLRGIIPFGTSLICIARKNEN